MAFKSLNTPEKIDAAARVGIINADTAAMLHADLAAKSKAPSAPRAPAFGTDDTVRGGMPGNVDNSGAPMLTEATKAAKTAKPIAPPKGTGTITFLANTRQGEREVKENITSPEDVDKYVAAGMITPAEGAQYKAEKWPSPKPPSKIAAGISGASSKGKKTIGAEVSAADTEQGAALKKADREALAADPAGNLQMKFSTGTPMSVAGKGLPWNATQGAGAAPSPYLPAAPAPVAASPYASGMTVHPDDDSYAAIIADARKKWGL